MKWCMAVAAAALVSAAIPGNAGAQTSNSIRADHKAGDDWLLTQLSSAFRADQTYEQIQQQAFSIFGRWSSDGRAVSAKSVAEKEMIQRAQQRAQKITQWAQFDLDGDGVVTRAEIETVIRPQASQPLQALSTRVPPTPEQSAGILTKLVTEALLTVIVMAA